jgi:aerobic carbon-monoxide dehydrogenase medium subunit
MRFQRVRIVRVDPTPRTRDVTNLSDVLVPASAEEAAAAFGDGTGVTVVAGGTIVMPEIKLGRLRPERIVYLGGAGLDRIERSGETYRIGAATPISALVEGAPEPLATFAAHVGDREIRSHATIGGNLCAPAAASFSRGDLQAPLLALDARVRSVGSAGERTESVDDFLAAGGDGRLVLEIEVDEPRRAATSHVRRPHAHAFTILTVAAADTASGVRVAVAGGGPRAVRAASVEQAFAAGATPEEAGQKALDDVKLQDDAVASSSYRRQVLPGLVARALSNLAQVKGA